jgi:hypothetical protein
MIIWSGMGFLVALIGFGSLFLTELLVESMTRDESFYQAHGWPKLMAFWVAALVVFLLDRALAGPPGRPGRNHSLFFIPMAVWPILFVVLGVVFMFVKD